jgi:D-alanyl-D-alanine carboxypeptidase (penicillin-binding protein 5/6)
MNNMIKRTCVFLFAVICVAAFFPTISHAAAKELSLDVKSYILMDVQTGSVLSEKDADKVLPSANVIKTMALLLFMESLDESKLKLTDNVTISQNAHKKGGTTVFLDGGKSYKAGDLLKAVIVCSANDACTALAEHLAGTEDEFVKSMNDKAKTLGLKNTKFVNTTGIDTDGQVTTARDMAVISCALTKHAQFFKWSSIYIEDFVHEGGRTTQMVNYNKLVRFYEGCDGIKTGSSSVAGYCISATVKKSGTRLVYVGLGSKNSDTRFEAAKKALDYGFSNFVSKSIVKMDAVIKEGIPVAKGDKSMVDAYAASDFSILVPKGKENSIKKEIVMDENLKAPLEKGQVIGKITVTLDGNVIGSVDLITKQPVMELEFLSAMQKILYWWLY